jgi:hypothetical protein
LQPNRQPHSTRYALRRGLVEEIQCETSTIGALEAAARVAPIRRLTIGSFAEHNQAKGWMARLAELPALAKIRSLEIQLDVSEKEALELLASPNLVRLEELRLPGCATTRLASALAKSPACAGLRELRLSGGEGIGAEGASAIAGLPLRVLSLYDQHLGGAGVAAIARMTTLRRLELEREPLGVEGARAIANAPALGELRELSISYGELREKGLAAIAGATQLGGLRVLEIGLGNSFNAKALAAMLDAWSLAGLRGLTVYGPLRAEGATLLAKSKALGSLESIDVSAASLGDAGAAALARWAGPPPAHVELRNSGIGAPGMEALAKGSLLAKVRHLNLAGNQCGGEGGKALAQGSKWLANLRTLRLFYNWMGVNGLRAILEQTPEIERLYLGENNYRAEVFRVGARGLLPRLRTLDLGDEGDAKLLEEYVASGHAHGLASLSVHHVKVREETARLLARLPQLESLHFSFSDFEGRALDMILARFAGLVTFWPDA